MLRKELVKKSNDFITFQNNSLLLFSNEIEKYDIQLNGEDYESIITQIINHKELDIKLKIQRILQFYFYKWKIKTFLMKNILRKKRISNAIKIVNRSFKRNALKRIKSMLFYKILNK